MEKKIIVDSQNDCKIQNYTEGTKVELSVLAAPGG